MIRPVKQLNNDLGTRDFELSTMTLGIVAEELGPGKLAFEYTTNTNPAWGEDKHVAAMNEGLQLVDVSIPESPTIIGSIDTPDYANGLALQNDVAFIADRWGGIIIVDCSTPSSPQLIATVSVPGDAHDISIEGSLAYVADWGNGLTILDIHEPEFTTQIGTIDIPIGVVAGVDVAGGFAYTACWTGGLAIVDVSSPTDPVLVSDIGLGGGMSNDVVVRDDFAYVSSQNVGLSIVDVSDPESPCIAGIAQINRSYGVDVSDAYTIVVEDSDGLMIYDGAYPVIFLSPDGTGDFASIQEAITHASPGWTICLRNGVYSGFGNRDLDFQGKDLILCSESSNPDSCFIDCQGEEQEPHRGLLLLSGETSEAVLDGITILHGYADEGGAIKLENESSPTIRNCVLKDNYATLGGALYCSGSSNPRVENTLMHSNEGDGGGAIACDNASPTFSNCTFSYNLSLGAGAAFLLYSNPIFENCILSHSVDGPAVFGYESSPELSCTDVVWNEGGDWVGCIADQQNENDNFSNTPAFCNPENGDFRLQPGSPCLPEHNSCGVQVGALGEGDCSPTVVEEVPSNARVALSAYPNPFNPHLTITFVLPADANGNLVVHDVSGRHVRVLKDGHFAQGKNEIVWNGKDDQGQGVASGVYFVRLVADEHQETKKVVLLR